MQELGTDNFYIELIENFPCSTREELRAREGTWIREIATLNKLVAGRDSKGYYDDNVDMLKQKSKDYRAEHKEYYKKYNDAYKAEHKEELKAKCKVYIEKNRDKIKEYKKQYCIANKQHIIDYDKAKYEKEGKLQIECKCGCVVTKTNLTRHQKTKMHEQLMKGEK